MFNLLRLILFISVLTISLNANEKVSLQLLWKHQFEFAGFYIAKEKGFYKELGLEVQIKEFDFGIDIVDDIVNSKTNIGIGRSSLVLDKLEGKDIVLLNAIFQDSPYVLISKKRSDLESVKDFKNKKIMLTDDLKSIAAISSMMNVENIKEDDYQRIDHSFNIHDLIEGKVDLATTYLSNEPFELKENDIDFTVFNPKDYGFNFYADILFTSQKYLTTNEEKIKKFQEASLNGWEYAFSHIDETVEMILAKYNTQDKTKEALIYEANILKKLAYVDDTKFGTLGELRIKEIANIYRLLGMTDKTNESLDGLIYKQENLFKKLLTWQFLFGIVALIVFFGFLSLYKQYILKKQNDVLEDVVNKKTAELVTYTKELEAQKELYDLVFENSSVGVLFIDLSSSQFVGCNDRVVKMLRAKSKKDVLNMHPSKLSPLFQPDGRESDEKANAMIGIALEKGSNSFEWKHLQTNGEEFWVEVSLTKITINNNDMLYVTWKDIDEKKKAEEELKQSQKELQEFNENLEIKIKERTQELEFAVRAKSDFLANMSHEIRTPLNGIIGFIDILHKNEKDMGKLKQLEIVKESGSLLLNIINDILDFSKIESGKVMIENIPIYTSKPFSSTVALFFEKAKEKDISIVLNIDKNLPERTLGDCTRIKQVFTNLLSNAIKFSKNNSSIIVNINYIEDKNLLYCEIIDKGVGIHPDNIKNIFNSFEQADSSVTRTYGGTGLGLTISKSLVEQMNGKLGVESALGVGSKFYFTIALFTVEEEVAEKLVILQNKELSGKVLIVEDNKTNQMLLSILLDDLNLESDIANNGLEAVEAIKSLEYDLILMDENMPIMNGKEATKIIRTLEGLKDIPIIAVTANALQGDKEKFLEAGMNDYIAKPIDANKLTGILNKYIGIGV